MTTKINVSSRKRRRPAGFDGFNFVNDQFKTNPGVLGNFQKHSWKTFQDLPYPTMKDEAWRRTDIKNLNGMVRLPEKEAYLDLKPLPGKTVDLTEGDKQGGRISILPGGHKVYLDPDLENRGVVFTDLISASRDYPNLLEQVLGQVVKPEDGKFAALTGAFAENGVFVYIPKGVQVNQPLHTVLWAVGENLAHFSHIVIWLDEDSSLTYVQENLSPDGTDQTLNGGIVEIHVGPNASLKFVELQSFGNNVWNFVHERAVVDTGGKINWIFGAFGTRLTKCFSNIDLVGDGAEGRMSGFFFTDGDQHLDHDTQQNHLAPHTTSDLLFKGALKGSSRSVWQGMIYVAPGAQQTDGYQANRNLILSENARADSIPGLEILADDVRCTHGATVGKIDPELIFYLRSRGIGKSDAERLIVEGFFEEIMERIPFDGVRQHFRERLEEKMAD
jgi:Fe-S cluster assembly protein SufD